MRLSLHRVMNHYTSRNSLGGSAPFVTLLRLSKMDSNSDIIYIMACYAVTFVTVEKRYIG